MTTALVSFLVALAIVAYSLAHRWLVPAMIPNRPELHRARYRTSLVTWIETGGYMPARAGWGVCRRKVRTLEHVPGMRYALETKCRARPREWVPPDLEEFRRVVAEADADYVRRWYGLDR